MGCDESGPSPEPVVDMDPDVGSDTGADVLPDAVVDADAGCDEGFRPSGDACVDIDECAELEPCDDRVSCINLSGSFTCGACPPGYVGSGFDRCALECPDGEHDGGDEVCRPIDGCSPGFALDDAGGCSPLQCPAGEHYDGAGGCLPEGECAEGFEPDRRGDCVPALCPPGQHDDGTAVCAPLGQCALGYVPDAQGDCTALSCPADDGREPDDTPGEADVLPADGVDAIACDELDVFRLAPEGACRVIVRLVAPGNVPRLLIVDIDGMNLADGAVVAGVVEARVEPDGPVFAAVSGQGAYRIVAAYEGHDGGDGSCVAVDTCAGGFHDGGDGSCVPMGECIDGFHDGGDGSCAPMGACIGGFHDGGDGSCVPVGECAGGFQDGGDGTCVSAGRCVAGLHDGGDGSCVPIGECVGGFQDGGDGSCVPEGACAGGFHDGGDGTCVPTGECVDGFQDGGDGSCVAAGTCAGGFQDGGDGSCVATGECVDGFQDGGDGSCVAVGACAGGFQDGGDGSCVAVGECVDGFHDGGDGACVGVDRCSPGYADGNGDAPGVPCLPDGACVRGLHDGGDGVCVALETCSPGHIDRGDGQCTLNDALSTACTDGYEFVFTDGGRCDCALGSRDGGDGACVADGVCSPGYQPAAPDARCAPIGACDPAHHATPWGDCRPTAECGAGLRDDGIGGCADGRGACVDGFFDRGGVCAAAPYCAPGFHDGGDGLCTADAGCAPGFRLVDAGCVVDIREAGQCDAFGFDRARPLEAGPPSHGAVCGLQPDTRVFDVDHRCGIDLRLVTDDPERVIDLQLFDADRTPLDRVEAIDGHARIWIPADGVRAGFVQVIPVAPGAEAPAPYRIDLVRDPARCAPCPAGSTADGAGRCIPPADGCAPGYQDGGDGECVPLDRCSPGFRDGGDSLCAPFDACGVGYFLDRSLNCVPLADCPDGERDDGTGLCAIACADALGYHEGGGGLCVARPFCAPGYADDLGDACVRRSPGAPCAAGVADPSGLCLAAGCPDGDDLSDSPDDAELLDVGLDGVTRRDGSLCPGDVGDWYRVAVQGSALLVRLRFDHGSNDMALRILAEDGTPLAAADSDDDDETLAIPPTAGAVIVEVTGEGGGAGYRLDLIRPAE